MNTFLEISEFYLLIFINTMNLLSQLCLYNKLFITVFFNTASALELTQYLERSKKLN